MVDEMDRTDLLCKECGTKIDCCDTPECVEGNHSSDSWEVEEEIFCDTESGMHYCTIDCLIEDYKEHIRTQGKVSEIIEERCK